MAGKSKNSVAKSSTASAKPSAASLVSSDTRSTGRGTVESRVTVGSVSSSGDKRMTEADKIESGSGAKSVVIDDGIAARTYSVGIDDDYLNDSDDDDVPIKGRDTRNTRTTLSESGNGKRSTVGARTTGKASVYEVGPGLERGESVFGETVVQKAAISEVTDRLKSKGKNTVMNTNIKELLKRATQDSLGEADAEPVESSSATAGAAKSVRMSGRTTAPVSVSDKIQTFEGAEDAKSGKISSATSRASLDEIRKQTLVSKQVTVINGKPSLGKPSQSRVTFSEQEQRESFAPPERGSGSGSKVFLKKGSGSQRLLSKKSSSGKSTFLTFY